MPSESLNTFRWRLFNASISDGYLCARTTANLMRWRTLRRARPPVVLHSVTGATPGRLTAHLSSTASNLKATVQTCPPTALPIQNP